MLPLVEAWGLANETMAQDSSLSNELYSDEGLSASHWLSLFRQTDLAISLMRNSTDELVRNLRKVGPREVIAANEFQTGSSSKHVLQRLAESIGINNLDAGNVPPFILQDNDYNPVKRPITIHPGRGKDDARCWQAASYATLVTRLVRSGQPVVLLAGPADMEQLKEVLKRLPSSLQPGMVSIMKNAPIMEVAKVMEKSKCYVGTDCGMTHMVALTGVPVVALFGPAYPLSPLGPRVELIKDRLERLSVDRVLTSLQKYV